MHIIRAILNLECVLSQCATPQIHCRAATLNLSGNTIFLIYQNALCHQETHSKSSVPQLDFPSATTMDNFNLHIISLRMTFVSYTNKSIQLIICFWQQTTAKNINTWQTNNFTSLIYPSRLQQLMVQGQCKPEALSLSLMYFSSMNVFNCFLKPCKLLISTIPGSESSIS